MANRAAPSDVFSCTAASIRSAANSRWVSAELGYQGGYYAMLRARASVIGPWERYALGCVGNRLVILSLANSRWVSAELGYGGGYYAMLRARASVIGPWEQYYAYAQSGLCQG